MLTRHSRGINWYEIHAFADGMSWKGTKGRLLTNAAGLARVRALLALRRRMSTRHARGALALASRGSSARCSRRSCSLEFPWYFKYDTWQYHTKPAFIAHRGTLRAAAARGSDASALWAVHAANSALSWNNIFRRKPMDMRYVRASNGPHSLGERALPSDGRPPTYPGHLRPLLISLCNGRSPIVHLLIVVPRRIDRRRLHVLLPAEHL